MAEFTVKNNLAGSLHIPPPVNRVLRGGERIVVDLTTAEVESSDIADMAARQIISVASANSPRIDDDTEAPTFAAVEVEHESYEYLGHSLSQSHFQEVLYDGSGDVSDIVNWTDAGKTVKVRESTFTRNGVGDILTAVVIQYTAGLESSRLTKTYAYNPDGSIASVTTVRS